jgi:hypothetical protein
MAVSKNVTQKHEPAHPPDPFNARKQGHEIRYFNGTSFEWPGEGVRPHPKFQPQLPNRAEISLFPDHGDGFRQWLEWDNVEFGSLDESFESEEYIQSQIPVEYVGTVGFGTLYNNSKKSDSDLLAMICENHDKYIIKMDSATMPFGIEIGYLYPTNLGRIYFSFARMFFIWRFFKRCKNCRVQFVTKNKYQQYHSASCRIQHHNNKTRPKQETYCLVCGKDISSLNRGAKTCCSAHRTALSRMRKREKDSSQ